MIDHAPPPPVYDRPQVLSEKVSDQSQEARKVFLSERLHKDASHQRRVFCSALLSDLSDADFRALCVYLELGGDAAADIVGTHKHISDLLRRSERTIRRSAKELETSGWLSSKRNGRKASTHAASIPLDAMRAIVGEVAIIRPTLVGYEPIQVPNLKPSTGQVCPIEDAGSTGQICPDRPDLSAQSTGQICPIGPDLAGREGFDRPNPVTRPAKVVQLPPSTNVGNIYNNNIKLNHAREVGELQAMQDRMVEVAGSAIANPAAAPSLLTFTDLDRWLNNGCDFEKDVLAGVMKSAHGRPARSIRSWFYFEGAVMACRDARLRELPPPQVNGSTYPPPQKHWREQQRDESKQNAADAKRIFQKLKAEQAARNGR